MTSRIDRLARASVALGLLAALTGCALTRPPSTVPPTGWPTPGAGTSASTQAGATPTTPATIASDLGVTVPVPAGYTDATDLVQQAQTSGPVRLVAFLRGPDGRQILVQQLATDRKDLDSYVDWYVASPAKGATVTVHGRRPTTMGGLPAVELTLLDSSDHRQTGLFVTMRKPGTVVTVTGDSRDAARADDLAAVAQGLAFT